MSSSSKNADSSLNGVNGFNHPHYEDMLEPEVIVAGRALGAGRPALLVAEIGLNHCGQLDRAFELIKSAADAGADAVKFQKRSPRELLTARAYNKSYYNGGNSFGVTYGKHREALEFEVSAYGALRDAAEELGMMFFASVWDLDSVKIINELRLPVVKIPSADLTNEPLIREISKEGIPIFISTGMSKPAELDRSVKLMKELKVPFVLFHCVSLYPTPVEHVKLKTLAHFRKRYDVPVGYSGHEMEIATSVAARSLGACVIEKHFTMDRSWKGGDQRISLLPDEFAQMVEDVRVVERGLLDTARDGLLEGEERQRKKLGKSIVASRDIAAGEIVTAEMIACKCPGGGLSPQHLDNIVGHRTKWSIAVDEYVLESHLELKTKAISARSRLNRD